MEARAEQDPAALERLDAELTLLAGFLEGHDFKALRAADEALCGGHDVAVEIRRDDTGAPTYVASEG